MAEEEGVKTTEPISVYAVLTAFVDQMAMVAWQKLGLQPDLLTRTIHKDLDEAKIAIDVTTHLASFIEPKLDEEDRKRIHNLIRDLRVNFVEQSRSSDS